MEPAVVQCWHLEPFVQPSLAKLDASLFDAVLAAAAGKRISAKPSMSQEHVLNISRQLPLLIARSRYGLCVVQCAPLCVKANIDTERKMEKRILGGPRVVGKPRSGQHGLAQTRLVPTAVGGLHARTTCSMESNLQG